MRNKGLYRRIYSDIWTISSDQKYIQSNLLLSHGFKHAFFTRKTDSELPQDLKKDIFSDCSIHILNQIHSDIVIEASNANFPPWPEADGLLSNKININRAQSLWIYSADCIPILFADIKTGKVAAVHAGWRGIAKNIIRETIKKLEQHRTSRRDLIIVLGPAISPQKYEVELSVGLNIYNGMIRDKKVISLSNESKIDELMNLLIIRKTLIKNKILLDIRQAAYIELINEGINKHQISLNNLCTFSEESLFFSRRRDGGKLFQWTGIQSRDNYKNHRVSNYY